MYNIHAIIFGICITVPVQRAGLYSSCYESFLVMLLRAAVLLLVSDISV